MKTARVLIAIGIMMAALNATAFLMLERRSRAIDALSIELKRALDIARDGGIIQTGEPPIGMLIMAFNKRNYGQINIRDLCGAVGRWNGQSLVHEYYEGKVKVEYFISHDMPDAWYPLPESLLK